MTKKYKSKVLAAAHETALGMTEAGVMSKQTMRKFDEMCLAPVEDMPPERTRTASRSQNRSSRASRSSPAEE